MEKKEASIKRLHDELMSTLVQEMNQMSESTWVCVKEAFQFYLSPGTTENNFYGIYSTLFRQSTIRQGEYKVLKDVFISLQQTKLVDLVDEYTDYIEKERKGAHPDIPEKGYKKPFVTFLEKGKSPYRHINVIIVGEQNVGRSRLRKFLAGNECDSENKEGGDGNVAVINNFEVDMMSTEWEPMHDIDYGNAIINSFQTAYSTPYSDSESEAGELSSERKEHDAIEKDLEKKIINASKKKNQHMANLSLWDVAGDCCSLQNLILSSDGVFVVVCNAQECLDREEKAQDDIVNWLRAIKTYSLSEKNKRHSPPILLVGTYADKIQVEDKEDVFRNFLYKLLDRYEIRNIDLGWHILVDFTRDKEETRRKLREMIAEAATYQILWKKEIFAYWLPLKLHIIKQKTEADGKRVVSLEHLRKLNRQFSVPIGENELKQFLRYLHASRIAIYFDQGEILSDAVITDPMWVIKAFRYLTSDEHVKKSDLTLYRSWKRFVDTATLTGSLLQNAWEGDKDFQNQGEVLEAVMKRVGLLNVPVKFAKKDSEDKFAIVPSRLKTLDLDTMEAEVGVLKSKSSIFSHTLYLVFEQKFLPTVIYDNLIASCISDYKIIDKTELGNRIGRCFGIFEYDSVWNMIVYCNTSYITLTLFKMSKTGKAIGKEIRKNIEEKIKTILDQNCQDIYKNYSYAFHCNFTLKEGEYLIPLKDLQTHDQCQFRCSRKSHQCRGKSHQIKAKDDLQFWGLLTESEVLQEGNKEEIEKKKRHHQMLQELYGSVYRDCDEWPAFKNMLKPYVSQHDLSRMTNIFVVADKLMQAELINYGKYDILLDIFHKIDMKIVCEIVQKYTIKPKDVLAAQPPTDGDIRSSSVTEK